MNMPVPFVALDRQYQAYKQEIDAAMAEVMESGMYVMGPQVEAFEAALAKICDVPYVLSVGNGTDALVLCMKALGIGEGDEVITAPNSFIASAGGPASLGAIPKFVDIREDHNIDPDKIENAISPQTKAIMPVHLTGRPADMDPINAIAKKHGLFVIEDSAQAIGATYKGKPVGSLGDCAGFSLHPLKNIFVPGDAGFISMKCKFMYEKIKGLRNHGLINRDECAEWGMNSRLDTLLCAIGLVKLKHFDVITARFKEIANMYREGLSDVSEIDLPEDTDDIKGVYHNFVICSDHRDALQKYLRECGIDTKIHYPILLHMQPAAKSLGYKEGDFPVAERQNKRQLSLPIYPEITQEEIDTVINAIKQFCAEKGSLAYGT